MRSDRTYKIFGNLNPIVSPIGEPSLPSDLPNKCKVFEPLEIKTLHLLGKKCLKALSGIASALMHQALSRVRYGKANAPSTQPHILKETRFLLTIIFFQIYACAADRQTKPDETVPDRNQAIKYL